MVLFPVVQAMPLPAFEPNPTIGVGSGQVVLKSIMLGDATEYAGQEEMGLDEELPLPLATTLGMDGLEYLMKLP